MRSGRDGMEKRVCKIVDGRRELCSWIDGA